MRRQSRKLDSPEPAPPGRKRPTPRAGDAAGGATVEFAVSDQPAEGDLVEALAKVLVSAYRRRRERAAEVEGREADQLRARRVTEGGDKQEGIDSGG